MEVRRLQNADEEVGGSLGTMRDGRVGTLTPYLSPRGQPQAQCTLDTCYDLR
jgi:hypothetical protein